MAYVRAFDNPQGNGEEVRVTTAPVIFTNVDNNNNAPIFGQPDGYHTTVAENAQEVVIETVTATDADYGVNARITFSMVDDEMPFIVGNETGEVSTTDALNREEQDQYTFEIQAKDGGDPSKQTRVNVTVNVTDTNDNVPQFESDTHHLDFNITRDESAGESELLCYGTHLSIDTIYRSVCVCVCVTGVCVCVTGVCVCEGVWNV